MQAKTAELDKSNTEWQAQRIDSIKATELQAAVAAKEAALDKAKANISALRAQVSKLVQQMLSLMTALAMLPMLVLRPAMVRLAWRPHPFSSQESRSDVSDALNPDVLQDTRKEAQLETMARELESARSEVDALRTALASLRSSERMKQSASASVKEEHQQVSLKFSCLLGKPKRKPHPHMCRP